MKGGKGEYSCLWLFDKLFNVNLKSTVEKLILEHGQHMETNTMRYLSLVEGYQQYPAVRCVQGENLCMCSSTAPQTVESMNHAKLNIREQIAVYPINAITLFLQL